MHLPGKVAIITGAGGSGCGRAIEGRLAHEGCSVVVNDLLQPGSQETVHLIKSDTGRASFFQADVSKESDMQALIEFAEKTYGGLDILINNASEPYRPQGILEDWFNALHVDLRQ